ncbi:D-alanine--D-alanine ligase [Luteitalea sp. TBR-22]|uniref:D-alanine--D-alanine ligase family protein n=1 Tax=Luteitalea sp. TBR-22 TaxID=2802971 RepID=UPI001AF96A42|nr:D-alanine--D-alanine ligase family protein [Luteitalea sp. TBR-22]BCS35588.1 D-alanine--D-alanine ligase [Luteitalea sp. TBR-22]
MKKLRVGVIYGGRSGEHEVSVASAAAVMANLDRTRYEPVPIRIDRDGRWSLADKPPTAASASEVIEQTRIEVKAVRAGREVHLLPRPSEETILAIDRTAHRGEDEARALVHGVGLDVIFPVLHGPHGEDGTVQGLLELANVPYVGCGVLASAVGMDKALMKTVFGARGLPQCAYEVLLRRQVLADPEAMADGLLSRHPLPLFVKPANLGSSVGISKARTRDELVEALKLAADYDRKVVVEVAVPNAREIEVAVLGNDEPLASVPGEIVPSREFYDYEAKYLDGASRLAIPADLPAELGSRLQALAIEAFRAIDGAGLSRVDFLVDGASGAVYVNEINTMPGFTTISMYGKLWAATGLAYAELVDRLVQLALERHAEKQQLRVSAF